MLPNEEADSLNTVNHILKSHTNDTITALSFNREFNQYQKKAYSLLILQRGNEVLLGHKKRGFGKGKWNGFGGKLEPGEDPITAAVREMKEESELEINTSDVEKVGVLDFTFEGMTILMEVHIFRAFKYSGIPAESDEMIPKWFDIDRLPYESMWPDDKIWYPLMLKGEKFSGHCRFNATEELLDHTIRVVDCLA